MGLTIAAFELRRRLRSVSTWIYFGIFLVLAYLLFIAAAGAFTSVSVGLGSGGKVLVNGPHTLASFISLLSYFMVLVIGSVSGQAIHQDVQQRTTPLFFTAPISKSSYLGGRLLGALVILLFIAAAIGLGCFAGSLMPFIEPGMIGPNRAGAYLRPYLVLVLPNLLAMSALFFGLTALTRSMRPVHVVGVLLLIGYLIASALTEKIENKTIASLLDPFGLKAFEQVTEYWTVSEKNQKLVSLGGVLLANRLIWLGVGALVLAFTWRRFLLQHQAEHGGRAPADATPALQVAGTILPTSAPTPPSPLTLLPRLTWLAFRETVKNVYFLVIVLAGVLVVILTAQLSGSILGTRTYPVTYMMIQLGGGSFALFLNIIVVLYSGELVWREREAGVDQIVDALPVPTWLPYLTKLGAMVLVGVLLQLVVTLCGIGTQVVRGYYHLELPLYAADAGLKLIGFAQLAALALFVQTVVNHRYVGYLVMVVYFIATAFLGRFGFEHNLYLYAGDPGYVYSDMNGFGPFLRPWGWFNLYWSIAAAGLALTSTLLWVRGGESRLPQRLRELRRRLTLPVRVAAAALALAFAGCGVFIFYNTNVLNRYETSADGRARRADYERRYKALEKLPHPKIESVRARFDLDPDKRGLRASGTVQLRNRDLRPVERVFVNLPEEFVIHRLALGALSAPTESDRRHGFHTFVLARSLAPGETAALSFDVGFEPRGFRNRSEPTAVVANGTFLHNQMLLGYATQAELADDDERRKQKLPPRERMPRLDDPVALNSNYVTSDADWIDLEITVCTRPGQTALAPGHLQRRFSEGGRDCFVYQPPGRVLNFFAVVSADYLLRRDRWRDVDIEIHHDPAHPYNVQRMVDAIKATLDYATTSFGPYQNKVVRVVEFPRYEGYAQSFPATIPYSESLGFIAEVHEKDVDDIDYPTFVTAHEVGHQWWAHQVVGANMQGSTLLSESLAEYTGLMVMKHRYGPTLMRRFLRYDLDRYLKGRSFERKKELPLLRVENQAYIHYPKGGMVMYALQNIIGEEAVSRALRALVESYAFKGPPYPTSRALIAELRKVAQPDAHGLITDLFENITLFENRAERASIRKLADGRYEVTATVNAKKVHADELGVETEQPLDDVIEVGVVDDQGHALHLEKHHFKATRQEITMTFSAAAKPAKAGIDPLNMLIDRRPDDNLIRLDDAGAR